MSQLIEVISDDSAQQLVGGKAWGKNWGIDKPKNRKLGNSQNIVSPIQSSAISTSNAIAINISLFSVNSPQVATATAVSSATSLVEGSSISA